MCHSFEVTETNAETKQLYSNPGLHCVHFIRNTCKSWRLCRYLTANHVSAGQCVQSYRDGSRTHEWGRKMVPQSFFFFLFPPRMNDVGISGPPGWLVVLAP